MIIFPKRGNEKTHQQNGVDTSKNTTKNVFVIEISRLRRVHFSRNSSQIYAEQLYDVNQHLNLQENRKFNHFRRLSQGHDHNIYLGVIIFNFSIAMQFRFFLEAIIGNIYIFLGLTFLQCFCYTGKYNYTIFKFLVFHFSGAAPSNPLEELGQCK